LKQAILHKALSSCLSLFFAVNIREHAEASFNLLQVPLQQAVAKMKWHQRTASQTVD
jgi:hypothetical protein